MTTVQDFTAAVDDFFDELEQIALAELAGRDAALIGALDPVLTEAGLPFQEVSQSISAALDGLVVPEESDLATEIVAALTSAGLDFVTAALDGADVILTFNGAQTSPLSDIADLSFLQIDELGLDLNGGLNLEATASLDLALRFSTAEPNGALSIESDAAAEDVRFEISATFDEATLPDTVSLGSIQGSASLGTGLNGAAVSVALDLDGDALDALSPASEVAALAGLAVDLDVGFGTDFLPGLDATLVVEYETGAEGEVLGVLSGVALEDITLGVDALDDLLDTVLGPLDDLVGAFPLGPVINLLTAPIPVVNDLAKGLDQEPDGRVTLNDLLVYFSGGSYDPTFVSVIGQIATVLDSIDSLASTGGVDLGSVSLSTEALEALVAGEDGANLTSAFEFPSFDTDLFEDVASELLDGLETFDTGGFSFPLLGPDAPELAAQILFSDFLAAPVPLVEFILPEFGLDREQASFEITIPVGPFAAVIEGGFEAAFRIGAGVSTRGLLDGAPEVENSLYLTTPLDGNGDRLPLAEFEADLGAGFGVKVPGVRVTVGGGILGEIEAGLGDFDEVDDGLAHLAGGIQLPCLFSDLSGGLSAGLNFTFAVGIKPLEWKRKITLAEIEIVNFNVTCSAAHGRDIPVVETSGLASLAGTPGDLWLNIGEDRAEFRDVPGEEDTIDEIFHVGRMPQSDEETDPPFDPTTLQVNAFGIAQLFDEADVSRLRGDGGDGDDVLTLASGIDLDVVFIGGAGEDILITGDGEDLVEGGAGDDVISTGDGDDTVRAGAGDDVIRAGLGADRIDGDTSESGGGGAGFDQVDYSQSSVGVQLLRDDDAVYGSGGLAEGDILTNVEYFIGTQFDDTLSGDDLTSSVLDGEGGDDLLVGGEADDLLVGGAGADALIGKGGNDTASYVNSLGRVHVDLATGVAFGSDATGDLLDRIENLQGSMHDDELSGDDGANLLDGFAGDDILDGRGGQDDIRGGGGNDIVIARADGDTLDGGGAVTSERDRDLLTYEFATGPITARFAPILYDVYETGEPDAPNGDLILGAFQEPDDATRSELRSSFEDLRGSEQSDDLGGDEGANRIEGGGGNDLIYGFAGNDTVAGGAGADEMFGGLGQDWLDYSESPDGVTMSLDQDPGDVDDSGEGGDAEGDRATGFENIIGSLYADELTGNDGDNIFDPLGVFAEAGSDTVIGGLGTDTLRLNYASVTTTVGMVGGLDIGSDDTGSFGFGLGGPPSTVGFEGIEQFEIHGTNVADALSLGAGDDRVWAGDGNDIIAGNLGSDIILADAGDDLVFSQIGETLGDGGGGAFFYLNGGAGFDGLSVDLGDAPNGVSFVMKDDGTERDDQIVTFGHGGVITGFEFIGGIGGTDFADELRQPGLVNNEFLSGGGDDILAPGLGIDIIDGGETPEDPSLPTDADLLILDYSVIDTGSGVVMFTDRDGSLKGSRRLEIIDQIQIIDDLVALNIEYAHITGSIRDDVLEGINDPFYDEQGDILRGLDGDDVLRTYNGPDDLQGGAGSDVLNAGDGDDRLQGGLAGRDDGVDTLRGGSGQDLFVLADETGQHYGEQVEGAVGADFAVIEDFQTGTDSIQLVGGAADYQLIDFGGNTFVRLLTDGGAVSIARIDGVTGLDLADGDFVYVSEAIDGPGGITLKTSPPPTLLSEAPPAASQSSVGDLSGDLTTPETFSVTQGEATTNLGETIVQSLATQGIAVSTNSIRIEREGDARAFGNFENGFGLESGVVLSTGDVRDWVGPNTEDGGVKSQQFGGNQFDLEFEQIGVLGVDGSPMTFYRANLADVPVSIRSLVLVDDDDGTGGAPGARSGADIAGLALTTADIADIETLTGGDLTLLDDPSVLPRLDLFDFSPLGTFFTQGEQRAFNPANNGGGGIGGIGGIGGDDAELPTSVEFAENTDGAFAGFVNNGVATLGQFDFDAGARTGYLSLGDGGQLGLNLTDVIDADEEVWLIVAEAGGSESFSGTLTASPQSLVPPGDASTDFGAPGAEDDTITYVIEFDADLSPNIGAMEIDGPEEAYVRLFDAILGSEELREFAGTELQDSISIRINGVEAALLDDGQAATLERLASGVSGPFHASLVPNWEGVEDQPTRYDAYAPLFVEGMIVEGLNRVEIVLSDQRDGFLDTGLLLAAASEGPQSLPQGPESTTFTGQEDTDITGALPSSLTNAVTYELAFEGGPSHGELTLSSDGNFVYTPDPDFAGQDSFVYIRTDSSGDKTFGQGLLEVAPASDAPDVPAEQALAGVFGQTNIGAITASDPDGDTLSYQIVGGADAAAFAIDQTTGTLTFLDAPQLAKPGDADNDAIFEVTISASDGRLATETEVDVFVLEEAFTISGTAVQGSESSDTVDVDQTQLVPTALGDLILGFGGDDRLNGLAGDDLIFGGDGDDQLIGGAGNDGLNGGDGVDTAAFSGAQAKYTLSIGTSSTTIEDRSLPGTGRDTVTGIEILDFDVDFLDPTTDSPFDLRSFGGAAGLSDEDFESVIELYIAYFNRAPDAVGLNFWGTQFANGLSLEDMADLFGPQPETVAAYPPGTTNEVFATVVYDNVLGRTPDPDGIAFWVGLLDSGAVSRDQFILEVLRGAKAEPKPDLGQDFVDQQLADRMYLSDKTDIGTYFAVIKGMSDTGNAAAAMELFDGDQNSIDAAIGAIDGFFAAAQDPATGEFLMPLVGVLDDPFL